MSFTPPELRAVGPHYRCAFLIGVLAGGIALSSCGHREVSAKSTNDPATAEISAVEVGVAPVLEKPVGQHLTVSSEFVPFQEIDVYAKESGYVRQIFVDYGTHVHAGQLMAVLEIPELEAALQEDEAAIGAQKELVTRAESEVNRAKAQYTALHLQYQRLADVAKSQAGLVAQQEVDDAQSKDLAQQSQVESAQGALAAVKGQLAMAQAKLTRDKALYSYSKITAPFDGVVTQRFANLGALMQAGTTSTQATPLVRLSQVNLFRLVIPVPETYVRYTHIGDPVEVRVPSLGRSFQGKVTRFSVDVGAETRTMHTEVDVPNPTGVLIPGLYAEAVLSLNQRTNALVVPVQAVTHQGNKATVFVVNKTNHLEERPITLGVQATNYVEVESGLKAGDQVVVTERAGLEPGELVRPKAVRPMTYDGAGQDDQGSK